MSSPLPSLSPSGSWKPTSSEPSGSRTWRQPRSTLPTPLPLSTAQIFSRSLSRSLSTVFWREYRALWMTLGARLLALACAVAVTCVAFTLVCVRMTWAHIHADRLVERCCNGTAVRKRVCSARTCTTSEV